MQAPTLGTRLTAQLARSYLAKLRPQLRPYRLQCQVRTGVGSPPGDQVVVRLLYSSGDLINYVTIDVYDDRIEFPVYRAATIFLADPTVHDQLAQVLKRQLRDGVMDRRDHLLHSIRGLELDLQSDKPWVSKSGLNQRIERLHSEVQALDDLYRRLLLANQNPKSQEG